LVSKLPAVGIPDVIWARLPRSRLANPAAEHEQHRQAGDSREDQCA
jgi:hypothetical protein